jgi:hypothetical protein
MPETAGKAFAKLHGVDSPHDAIEAGEATLEQWNDFFCRVASKSELC